MAKSGIRLNRGFFQDFTAAFSYKKIQLNREFAQTGDFFGPNHPRFSRILLYIQLHNLSQSFDENSVLGGVGRIIAA
jgi:hypothetical protein